MSPVGPENRGLTWFNALPPGAAERELLSCCAARPWAEKLAAGRPYADRPALLAASDAALAGLAWDDVADALAGHPRIGDRAEGEHRDAAWSRGEQSGVGAATAETRAALVEGNAAYEERFGYVFLICATGLSADTMLAELRRRLGHNTETERGTVREELRKITRLRLHKLLEEGR